MNNLKISKTDYCKMVKSIQEYLKESDKASDALEVLTDGMAMCTVGFTLCDDITHMLMDMTFDNNPETEDSYLEWWLYSTSPKILFHEDHEINVENIEDLYDFLEMRNAN